MTDTIIHTLRRIFPFLGGRITFFGRTDTGRVRKQNEDSFCILADRNIFMVADGMGGHNAGEVASAAAIETLAQYYSKDALRRIRSNREEIQHFFVKGFHHANQTVMDMAAGNAAHSGMGCTLVVAMIAGNTLHVIHVGDSRCYLADASGMEQITADHSCITEFHLTTSIPNENGNHEIKLPPRQAVTRVIGFPFPEDPEYNSRRLKPHHRILICSDGLWSMVGDPEIHRILTTADSAEQACDLLIRQANENGGRDNITALAIFC